MCRTSSRCAPEFQIACIDRRLGMMLIIKKERLSSFDLVCLQETVMLGISKLTITSHPKPLSGAARLEARASQLW
jgi:hypothetical protein